MKKKFGLMIVAGLLILGTVIGGTLAGMTARTERMAVAQIATKTLHVGLNDGMKGQTASETENLVMEPMVPGDEKEALSTVTNTGDYPVYVRVWVTRYFLEKTEGRMEKIFDLSARDLKASCIGIHRPDGARAKWLVAGNDAEELVLYYVHPLQPGETTSAFLQSLSLGTEADNRYADLGIGLELKVDAIQAAGADRAMPSEWGIYPTIDGDGTITGIEE